MTTTINELLDQFRAMSRVNRERGTWFEELMVSFLKTDPTYADQFSDVWLWMEWPDRDGPDTGIDLVARERESGGLVAIQCKFYEPDHSLQKADIDSFFTASGKRLFTRRLIMSTTDKWSTNAEKALANQQIPVNRLGMAELMDSPIEWDKIAWPTQPGTVELPVAARKVLRTHQRNAIDDVAAGFVEQDRGKLIMACGTGKTFTSLKLAEQIALANDADETFVLFCVPSISLLSQTLKEWTAQCELPLRSFAVCSDSKVSRDNEDIAAHDLAFPATTDAARLVEQSGQATTFNAAGLPGAQTGKRLSVVFTTYQSIGVISAAQALGLPDFDLVLCDEAHRTTGVTLAGADESAFVKIHDNDFITANKRLYMTATPKLFKDEVKKAAKERDALLCSMDNTDLYGPELHRLGFGEAVDKGLLTDYKVLILTVDEKYLTRSLQSQIADDNNEISLDDAVKIIGCWNGLAKRSGQFEDGSGFPPGSPPMRRAVAFNRTIADSRKIVEKFSEVLDSYNDAHEGTLAVEAEHVDGTFNSLRRNRLLEWLKEPTEADTCRILSNARCLSEGVDVPDLDAVLFLSPRNSQVDVVQSVGRVMRKTPDKDYGYIILPVGIPSDMSPETALRDNKRYKVVWQVLQALRAHDDRFNATVNKIDLNTKKPKQIMVGHVGGGDETNTTSTGTGTEGTSAASGDTDAGTAGAKTVVDNLALFQVDEWRDAIYAKIVEKVGEKAYWEQWAASVSEIAARHVDRITILIEDPTSEKALAFDRFLDELRAIINPGVSREDAIDMLAQHLITKPVFDAIFGSYEFSEHNPVSQTMQRMLDTLEDQALGKELDTLEDFYANVRLRAEGIDNHEGRQKVITELYERFFKTALPKTADAFGIVYTPIPIVDFILRATDQALQRHFDASLTDPGVQVLDPFTGTGTFIVRLLQSGLIKPEDLLRKYTAELHANEVLLLAYYIAAINIEAAYHQIAASSDGDAGGEYVPFDGIVLTDTFQLAENPSTLDGRLFPENNQRIQRQKDLDIRVILGNPPYSVGQTSSNDNNQNQKYPVLDSRIEDTYAKRSTATNKNSLYDSYIRAIRWASDRVGDDGVIAYVSNGGYIDSNTADGLRLCLTDEFSHIYCYNLRGNTRTSGETGRKESDNVFKPMSRNTIAILILVKTPQTTGPTAIHYRDIGDYLTREQKLAIVNNTDLDNIDWDTITPNTEGDWINQRNTDFDAFTPIGEKGTKDRPARPAVFATYSGGLKSNRDSWVFNYSRAALGSNVRRMVEFYNEQTDAFLVFCAANEHTTRTTAAIDGFIDHDPTKISWNRGTKNDLARGIHYGFDAATIRSATYRPFTKERVYFDRQLNDMVYKLPTFFPTPLTNNLGFYLNGVHAATEPAVLALNEIPCLDLYGKGGQFFPRWSYSAVDQSTEEAAGQSAFDADLGEVIDGYRRIDNITDTALADYQGSFGGEVTKDDIFYYVYGLLHSPEYRTTFASDLKKMLPRIPKATAFKEFTAAGRRLADLHLNYESVEPYPLEESHIDPLGTVAQDPYRVTKMTFGKAGKGHKDQGRIVYNAQLTLSGIPEDAYRYMLGPRSAIEWIMERYQIKTDPSSGIVNDPNDWSTEIDDARYIVDLVKRVVTVSIETMKIVDALPGLDVVDQ